MWFLAVQGNLQFYTCLWEPTLWSRIIYIDRSSSLICNSAVWVTVGSIVEFGIGMKRGMDPGLWFLKTFGCRLQSILEMFCIHFWAVWHMQAPQRKTLFRFKMHALLIMESSDHFMSTSTACDSLKIPCNENTQPLTSPPFFSSFFHFDLHSPFYYHMGVSDQFRFPTDFYE
jgi:hypothetical protein